MIITKHIEWMRDYVNSVEHLVPKVKYVKRITSKRSSPDRNQLVHGVITYVNSMNHKISIYVSYKDKTTNKIKNYSTISLLHTLAHELAHLDYFEHNPDRLLLECEITKVFARKLKKAGYISEEDEDKNGSFYKGE